MSKANTPNSCGSQKKQSPIEKPAMFAFCFKPRGLEVKHRGTKHRSQKKISVYAQHSSTLGDYDVYNSSGNSFLPAWFSVNPLLALIFLYEVCV